MQRFILRRAAQTVITLWLLSIIVFLLARLTGDPTALLLPLDAPPEAQAALRHTLGLDQPYHVQYWAFISHAVRGDFGDSIRFHQASMTLVMERLPNSIGLAVVAMGFALLFTFPLGVVSALNRGKPLDQAARFFSVLGVTAPAFLIGILLIQVFAVNLRWLPASGMSDWRSFVMPGVTLGLFALAFLTRLLRSSMLSVLDSEFVKLARLKGVSERVVIWKHALRNAVIPVITMGGIYFALFVTMAVVVETVFAWPGIGRLAYDSVYGRDFPVIQAVVIVIAALVMAVNLLVDVAYAYVDPRIRHR